MAVGAVFVPVVPALRLPAPVQVVVVGFVELAGVGHRLVGTEVLHLPIAGFAVDEDEFALLFDRLAVEQVVVAPKAQECQPGQQDQVVVREPRIVLDEAEVEDVAVEVAHRAIVARDFDGDHLAHHVLEFDVGLVGQDFDSELEILAQSFIGIQTIGNHQYVRRAVFLGERQAHQACGLALRVEQRLERIGCVGHVIHGLLLDL